MGVMMMWTMMARPAFIHDYYKRLVYVLVGKVRGRLVGNWTERNEHMVLLHILFWHFSWRFWRKDIGLAPK